MHARSDLNQVEATRALLLLFEQASQDFVIFKERPAARRSNYWAKLCKHARFGVLEDKATCEMLGLLDKLRMHARIHEVHGKGTYDTLQLGSPVAN